MMGDWRITRVAARLERLVGVIETLATTAQDALEQQKKAPGWWERNGTPATVFVSAIALCATVGVSVWQGREGSRQFEETLRQDQYAEIVNGLDSPLVGIQISSIRKLRQYVADPSNYDDSQRQQDAALDAAQTLTAFIAEESATANREGLAAYRDPPSVVVSAALRQLLELAAPPSGQGGMDFGGLNVDLSRGDFHGLAIPDVAPDGLFVAVAADFRGAAMTGWDLSDYPSVLAGSFFTCANLQVSDLGTADVAAADFTGANLRGADLSDVRNLTQEQLRGALVGKGTALPPDIEAPRRSWGTSKNGASFVTSPRCRYLMDRMTHLAPGSGYSARIPCPSAPGSRWSVRLSQDQQTALERACRLRAPTGQRPSR